MKPRDGNRSTARVSPETPTPASRQGQLDDLNDGGLSLDEHRYHSSSSGELAEEVDCAGSTAHKEISEQESETSLQEGEGEEEEGGGEEEEGEAADTGNQVNDGSNS